MPVLSHHLARIVILQRQQMGFQALNAKARRPQNNSLGYETAGAALRPILFAQQFAAVAERDFMPKHSAASSCQETLGAEDSAIASRMRRKVPSTTRSHRERWNWNASCTTAPERV